MAPRDFNDRLVAALRTFEVWAEGQRVKATAASLLVQNGNAAAAVAILAELATDCSVAEDMRSLWLELGSELLRLGAAV